MRYTLIVALIAIALFSGCAGKEEVKAPVIKVEFQHYLIDGKHVLKIENISKDFVNVDDVSFTLYPEFPGIHVFGIYSKGVTPVYVIDINKEGRLVGYVGFEKDKLPSENESVMVIVAVRNEKGDDLAIAQGVLKWT
ncbi:hypothetical protein [Geoglobus acetivorans]|uniref:Lipoprotein n=1 Tax=Geoglobus acetivorans TaxID=565033 RepID=A0ABZ3H484_GEOAI|nr:hypothetical protein [Geoglobus acetivorans]